MGADGDGEHATALGAVRGGEWRLLWNIVGGGSQLCWGVGAGRVERDGTSVGRRGTVGHRLEHWLDRWRAICGMRRVAVSFLRWHHARRWQAGCSFGLAIAYYSASKRCISKCSVAFFTALYICAILLR